MEIIWGSLPVWVGTFSGDGDGSGYGYGSGYGDGSGYGYGYGYGSGYGDGSGYGSGYGDGDGYWTMVVTAIMSKWSESQCERLTPATLAFWKSDRNGKPANGGTGEAATPGLVQVITGPLKLCAQALHATLAPDKWKGDRLWIVALHGEVRYGEGKMGALKREIICEVK